MQYGIDISVIAGTKYLVGHSDAMFGIVTCQEEHEPKLRRTTRLLGQCAGPDDVYLALRGLRTLAVRLARHQETALALCHWLAEREEVARVLYPALPQDPGHEIWRRDFGGASGLFGLVLARPYSDAAVSAFVDGLELFGIGSSWGGFESLVIPFDCDSYRTATKWAPGGPTLRLHIGLENVDDLKADLDRGFAALKAAI